MFLNNEKTKKVSVDARVYGNILFLELVIIDLITASTNFCCRLGVEADQTSTVNPKHTVANREESLDLLVYLQDYLLDANQTL